MNQTHVEVPKGFKIEKLLSPTADSLGSWVSLTHVKENLFVSSDQYGKIYWLNMPKIGSKDSVEVTPLNFKHLGKAQGLLWSHNSLYVMMNDRDTKYSGLYRLFDSSRDGHLDSALFLKQLDGWGEHGPHGIQLGPDNLIYVIAGNHTNLPNNHTSRSHSPWAEDRIIKSMRDPNGHASCECTGLRSDRRVGASGTYDSHDTIRAAGCFPGPVIGLMHSFSRRAGGSL